MEELTLDTLALEDAAAKCAQQGLVLVLLDYNVLVGPRIAVSDRLAPRGLAIRVMMSGI